MNIYDKCCRSFQDLIENNNYFIDNNIECQMRKRFEEFKTDFKYFNNKDYIKKNFDTIENKIELQLENFFNDTFVFFLIQ